MGENALQALARVRALLREARQLIDCAADELADEAAARETVEPRPLYDVDEIGLVDLNATIESLRQEQRIAQMRSSDVPAELRLALDRAERYGDDRTRHALVEALPRLIVERRAVRLAQSIRDAASRL